MIKEFNGKIIDNFIDINTCNELVNFVKNVEFWENSGSSFWDNRTLNAITIYNDLDKEVGKQLYNIQNKIKNILIESYGLKEEIYSDMFQIVRWFPGMEQELHADDMTNVDNHEWFHHRKFGTILYLNDDYLGGNTYYPDHNISIKPIIGRLAIHPGDTDHIHGVTKIEGSTRYTLISFWTFEKEYNHEWYAE